MNTFNKIFFASFLAISFSTNSALAKKCTNNSTGDDYLEVVIGESIEGPYISIQMNETTVYVPKHDYVTAKDNYVRTHDGEYILINPEQRITVTREGFPEESRVSGLLRFKGRKATLNLRIDDYAIVENQKMNCTR